MESATPTILVPVATVVAALITGAFTFLNLVISKEQKVSEFRQAWIDKLREEISQYLAALNVLAGTSEVWQAMGYPTELEYRQAMQAAHMSASQSYTSILLRIHASDGDESVRRLNQKFLDTIQSTKRALEDGEYEQASDLSDALREDARPILKREWERVKAGERIYRVSRGVAVAVFAAAILYGGWLGYRWHHNQPPPHSGPAIQQGKPARQP